MDIKLVLCSLGQIRAFLLGGKLPVPFVMLEGALPPAGVLKETERIISSGIDPFWIAPWLFIQESTGLIIGSGCFKGAPNEGIVEVGFGVVEPCRGRGYATSGLQLLVQTAFDRAEITEVRAETALGNIPSRCVVQKAGFVHSGQRDTIDDGKVDMWRIVKRKCS